MWDSRLHDRTAVLTYTRPPENVLGFAGLAELDTMLQFWAGDERARVIVLTGGLPGYFVAHADLADVTALVHGTGTGPHRPDTWERALSRISAIPQPVIAAVNGQAWGGGLELALSCLMRVASPAAHFRFPEVADGAIPGAGGTQRLPRLIGLPRAARHNGVHDRARDAQGDDLRMRLATVLCEGAVRAGVVAGDDPAAPRLHLFDEGTDVLGLVCAGLPAALAAGAEAVAAGEAVPLSDVVLLAPLQPPTVRDFVAFEEHLEGVRASMEGSGEVPGAWYAAPKFYFTNPYAVVASGHEVAVPPGAQQFDFELEVAAVIGTAGHDLDPAEAHRAIFGYCVLNDWSARDLQRREMQVGLGPAKGKDSATTLGPRPGRSSAPAAR